MTISRALETLLRRPAAAADERSPSGLRAPRPPGVAAAFACLVAAAGCDRGSSTGSSDVVATSASSSTLPSPPASASASASAAPSPTKPTGPKHPLNVLLLTIDSMRADMPWTTYDKKIAPNLTALAKASVVYTNAYAVSSYTAKSVAAMLTGRYPSSLYRTGVFFTGYSDANLFFTEVLQEHGISTIGVHAHLYFGPSKNLNQGFSTWELVPGITFDAQTDNHVTSDKMTTLAKKLLSRSAIGTDSKWFAWLHYMDPHDVYVRHEESPDFGKNNRGRYDSEMFYTDLHVGKLFEFLKAEGWWENTAIVVSADHGEAFGEHGRYKHAFDVWEVLTRVPLLVRIPDVEHQVVERRRSQIDLAPTILELMGVTELPESFVGKSMVRELYGAEEPGVREPIVLDLPEDSHNPPRRAVISGNYKLTVHGTGWKKELYDLAKDPDENEDLADEQPEKLKEMWALYQKTWDAIGVVAPFGGAKLKSGGIANGPKGPTPQARRPTEKAPEKAPTIDAKP